MFALKTSLYDLIVKDVTQKVKTLPVIHLECTLHLTAFQS